MNFLIDVEKEDYHGLEGADFLKRDNVLYIFHENRSGLIPKLYSEILKRTEAEVFFCKNKHQLSAVDAKINELYPIGNPNDVIYIGHRFFGQFPSFDTIMEAVYAGCIDGADQMVNLSELENELSKKESLHEIARSLSLDYENFLKVFASNQNDTKRLYQELKHEFGGEKGLAAYRSLKDKKIGPFGKNKKKTKSNEPIIFSDITIESHRKTSIDEDRKKQFWQSRGFTPLWQQRSIYEEDEDEFF